MRSSSASSGTGTRSRSLKLRGTLNRRPTKRTAGTLAGDSRPTVVCTCDRPAIRPTRSESNPPPALPTELTAPVGWFSQCDWPTAMPAASSPPSTPNASLSDHNKPDTFVQRTSGRLCPRKAPSVSFVEGGCHLVRPAHARGCSEPGFDRSASYWSATGAFVSPSRWASATA